MKHIFVIILGIASLLASGCGNKFNLDTTIQQIMDGYQIISHRPQTNSEFIAIVKLKTPALLETAKKDDEGKLQIDPERIAAIEAEQNEALKQLQQLSSEIRILYKYKMVLNGFALVAPISVQDKLKSLMQVSYVEGNGTFSRPEVVQSQATLAGTFEQINSVKWIGADKLHEKNIRGQGIKVGIIDTGIDFSHKMLGGPGTEEAFKSVDPTKASSLFPNSKVVGGVDLAGTDFDSSSGDFKKHIPFPDENPIDEGGHGTHVAGTVAGIGDGKKTYDGVAPDALLYAIKVFGAKGSTGDATVIAALEYAVDPTGNGTAEGKLDIVNMSLGSSYGTPHVLYSEAIRNLVTGGEVLVVASAGNSGHRDFIVGSPSINDEAFSVAASVDNMTHNWKFSAVEFKTPSKGSLLAEAIQGSISKPVAEVGDINGKLVYVGLADKNFDVQTVALVKGNIALIDRGVVTFADKIKRAYEAGALGVIVANNQSGQPISMGGEGKWDIPAIMITQALGNILKEELKTGDVTVHFQTDQKIEKPELIDTLTGFSSKGPRSIDGHFKPEISAPGANIISADMGKGDEAVQLSGTSMAAPHIAGVMALLKQKYSDLSPAEFKSLVMGHAKLMIDDKKEIYPLSQQGAGRVQVDASAQSILVSETPALSLGILNLESKKRIKQKIKLKNILNETQKLVIKFNGDSGLTMSGGGQVALSAGGNTEVSLFFEFDAAAIKENIKELDGHVKIFKDDKEIFRIPVLGIVRKLSQIEARNLLVRSSSEADAAGSSTELNVKNKGLHVGDLYLFNLLGTDGRKEDPTNNKFLSKVCDMQAVGYRIQEKDGKNYLQIGVKLYEPMTTWNTCEVTVLIDQDGDEVPDQELAGFALENVKGLSAGTNDSQFLSTLFDARKVRELRKKFEIDSIPKSDKKIEENYKTAVLDQQQLIHYDQSTLMILEADVDKLAKKTTGELSIKIATLHNEASAAEMDDYLSDWMKLSVNSNSQSFLDLPEKLTLLPQEEKTVDFSKGEGNQNLLILMPQNKSVFSEMITDQQSQILAPIYKQP